MHCIDDHQFSSDFKFNDYKKISSKKMTERKKSKLKHSSTSTSNKTASSSSQEDKKADTTTNSMEIEETVSSSIYSQELLNDNQCNTSKMQDQLSQQSVLNATKESTKSHGMKFSCTWRLYIKG